MNRKVIGGTQFKGFVSSTQGSVERLAVVGNIGKNTPISIGKVLNVYSDKNACDVLSNNGMRINNVQCLTKGGLVDESKIWGEVELPSVGSYVLIAFVQGSDNFPVIIGTIFPYANSKFQSSQNPVNSGSKAFTKKLLENGKTNTYKKIFKSGASIEIQEDGTVIIESPSGGYIRIKASANEINLSGDSKTLVTFAALKTAIQNLVSTYNSHTHVDPQGGSTAIPTQQQTLSMDSSEATKVKTS